MSDLFIDLYQGREIASARADAANAHDRVGRAFDEIAFLKKRLERMILINAALWELLKDKTGLTDIDLRSKVLEVDAADGAVDGRVGGRTGKCRKCAKSLHPRHAKCLYCGCDNTPPGVHASI